MYPFFRRSKNSVQVGLNMTTEEALTRIGKTQGTLMKLIAQLEGLKILLYTNSMPESYEEL
jgi:hypothetical protein